VPSLLCERTGGRSTDAVVGIAGSWTGVRVQSGTAVDCNLQGRAYLLHAPVGEAPESFDQHAHSNTLDRIEIDHRPPRHGIVPGLQEHFTR
jgi:hypothetical protein